MEEVTVNRTVMFIVLLLAVVAIFLIVSRGQNGNIANLETVTGLIKSG